MAKLSELVWVFSDTKIAVRYVMERDGYKQITWDGESKTTFGVKRREGDHRTDC